MCGIAGLWWRGGMEAHTLRRWGQSMSDTLVRRGPDGQGLWLDASRGLVLVHRRLAIVDRSQAAAQPMADADQRRVLVFNGEIYNHAQWWSDFEVGKRAGGQGAPRSDTASLHHALSRWGVDETCARAHAMFALAWWSADSERLTLARDRVGEKPLLVVQGPWGMAFASQLSTLLSLPWVARRIDPHALGHYLSWGHPPPDATLIEGIERVPAGEIQEWEAARRVSRRRYWQAHRVAVQCAQDRLQDDTEIAQRLDDALRRSVRERLMADVRVGAFLSGGIDSSLVVALMQREGDGRTPTFSIGFDDPACDESAQAEAIARALGTVHRTFHIGATQAASLLPDLAEMMDEPLGDASALPTAWLARHAAPHARVVLTGDGGDEVFGGYPRYRQACGWMGLAARAPRPMRHLAAQALESVRPATWTAASLMLPARIRPTLPASKADKLVRWLRSDTPQERARGLMLRWDAQALRLNDGRDDGRMQASERPVEPSSPDLTVSEQMQLHELQHDLPCDMLAKMDRATMWSSVEARAPLLDPHVVELAWRVPPRLKSEGARTKEVLRQHLSRHLDPALFDHPKRGFSAPLSSWMKGDLREPVEDLLGDLCRHTQGRWNTTLIRDTWQRQSHGVSHEVDRLWGLVALESWRRRWNLELP